MSGHRDSGIGLLENGKPRHEQSKTVIDHLESMTAPLEEGTNAAEGATSLPKGHISIGKGKTIAEEATEDPEHIREDIQDSTSDYSFASPTTNVVYRLEYKTYDNEVVFAKESQTPENLLDRKAASFEIITTAYTTYGKGTYVPDDTEKRKPPPVNSWGGIAIVINADGVIHALRTVVGYYPDVPLSGDSVKIHEPYAIIVHHQRELEEYREHFASSAPHPQDCIGFNGVYDNLGFLLDYVEKKVGKAAREERERHNRETPVATHNMLWMLFKPGTDVYFDQDEDGDYNAFVVKGLAWGVQDGTASTYTMEFWNIDCNSMYVGASTPKLKEIPPFIGERPIASLPAFPCRFLNKDVHKISHEEKEKALQERGKMFYKLQQQPRRLVKFEGESLTYPKRHYWGQAVVDMVQNCAEDQDGHTYPDPELATDVEQTLRIIPPCKCTWCDDLVKQVSAKKKSFAHYSKINPLKVTELTPHQLFLCSAGMTAFLLKIREWKILRVEGFSEPEFQTGLIDTLVIPEITRSVVKDLTHRYTRKDNNQAWGADFVKGKGEGMIFLLHGKPGVGKTYTAECVAEEAKRPLISLTCSDIGTDPALIERRLQFWFKLAKSWGAVLLLDEADVYMEQRTVSDLKRNNLVASFLRTLEYYQGILFLTTNRVGAFDEAFLSRIDIPIYYPDFTSAQREKIWNSFFWKLERERENELRVHRSARSLIKDDQVLLSLEWNAREIRNAFQTAVALAEVEDKKGDDGLIAVTAEHIRKVVEMSKGFKDYLKDLYQKNEAERAAQRGIRYDQFGKDEVVSGKVPV